MLGQTRSFLRDLWALTRPYWFSEERWAARGLLAAVVAMNLGMVYVLVLVNEWNNLFYNALEKKDFPDFLHQLMRFSVLAAIYIALLVYGLYLRQFLQIRWRRWLTERLLGDWLANQSYYRLQLSGAGTDNPDQRIADDLNRFVDRTLTLSLDLLSNAVTIVSFLGILWDLSGSMAIPLGSASLTVPGYLVWIALIYSVLGTWLTHMIGRQLPRINFDQQRLEADFRFSLVRLRENAEGIALYRGEADEARGLRSRFAAVIGNWRDVMRYTKRLNWFKYGFGQVADVFPYVVAAPAYFFGTMQLGGLMQTGSAFGRVQGAMSWFVNMYPDVADWKATVDRLTGFQAALARTVAASGTGIERMPAPQPGIALDEVEIRLPGDRPLINQASLQLVPGQSVLISGPSGSGKSTLFRVLGGLWPYGNGRVTIPFGAKLLFLPQRPYLPLGTLRDVVTYPQAPEGEGLADEAIRRALADCGLPHLADRLDEVQSWAQQLSPGEQQRIAFVRALLQRPDWLFLDEATAALDEAMEARLYGLLVERLPATTIVSVGHRAGLARFHQHHIVIAGGAEGGRLTRLPAAAQVSA